MITFENFIHFGVAEHGSERVRIGSQGFLQATNFAAMVITCGSRESRNFTVEYGDGYPAEVHDYICSNFVLRDPLYMMLLRDTHVHTWDGSAFPEAYAARRWLKPLGFRNGVSLPIRHETVGEVGSVHINSYDEVISDRQLDLLNRFATYLSGEFATKVKRQHLNLSERELGIVRLIASGASNPEIADELFISRSTVRTHVENILRKFGAGTRVGIAVEAVRLGLV